MTFFAWICIATLGITLLGVFALLWSSLAYAMHPQQRSTQTQTPRPAKNDPRDLAQAIELTQQSLQELEHDHALGKIDHADFQQLQGDLEAEQHQLQTKRDQLLAAYRQQAEAMLTKLPEVAQADKTPAVREDSKQ